MNGLSTRRWWLCHIVVPTGLLTVFITELHKESLDTLIAHLQQKVASDKRSVSK